MKFFYLLALLTFGILACSDEMSNLSISESPLQNAYFSSPDASYFLLSGEEYILLDREKLDYIKPEWLKSVEIMGEEVSLEKFGETAEKGAVIIIAYPNKLDLILAAAA